jgi:hypothetical protein
MEGHSTQNLIKTSMSDIGIYRQPSADYVARRVGLPGEFHLSVRISTIVQGVPEAR